MHELARRRSHHAGTLPLHVPRPLEQPGLAERLLALQRSQGNQAVQRLLAGRAPAAPVLQRQVRIAPDDYARGRGVPQAQWTQADLDDYLHMAVADELKLALQYADEATTGQWRPLIARLRNVALPMDQRVAAVASLVTELNRFLTTGPLARRHARDDRYSSEPQTAGYKHSGGVGWRDDLDMREKFGTGLGARGPLPSTAARGQGTKPLTQLPWATATQLLPRPLLNLLFDVRFQLETQHPKTVVDERTDDERARRERSPNAPGSLRSWHQDSAGALPANEFDAEAVPAHATELHAHYGRHSQAGAGSATSRNQATAPQGWAEYTGTGSTGSHNTKVVLDYVRKRVYLTLTHYQYWALIETPGGHEMFVCDTQELVQAQGRVDDRLKALQLDADKATLMSPWLEVLVA